MSAMSDERMIEVDNRSRETATKVEDHEAALVAIQQGLMGLQATLKQLFLNSLSSQIMEETITRYMAGYEVGDYTKEVELAQNNDVKTPADFKLLVKDPSFNQERFNGLAEEIGRIMITARAKAAKEAQESERSTLLAPDGRPALKVVK